ncbi:DUF2637 domain-containing protein [Cellulomonas triticagri]|uniref:DUF2637 domain-containing protein n=1 Tax=Cellulomonas triticagri TaxID=2483352 RepID=A0A3M2J7L2_9CELL|nr:DUF2637 domain-containing protein [Cellulomonas triticagri]RMI09389.1 DUF2637 domain-containing protein [Cellulomonas triticagri]
MSAQGARAGGTGSDARSRGAQRGASTRSGFAGAMWPGLVLSALLAALAFALSFSALRAVGVASGIEVRLGWMFPLIIDGFILLATWAAWRFRTQGLRGAWYPWAAFVVFSAVSMTGNALHAHPVQVEAMLLEPWAATAFSTVPAVALLLASHMLLLITTHTSGGDRADTRTDLATVHDTAPAAGQDAVSVVDDRAGAGLLARGPQAQDSSGPAGPGAADRAPAAARPPGTGSGPGSGGGFRGQAGASPVPAVHRASVRGSLAPALGALVPGPGVRHLAVVTTAEPAAVLTPERPLAPTAVATSRPAAGVARAGGALGAWVAERAAAGEPVTGADVVAAGLAGSATTARRHLRELRATHPEVFTPTGTPSGGQRGDERQGAL